MPTLQALAQRNGFTIKRGRLDPTKFWLIDSDGRLLTDAAGADRDVLIELLNATTPAAP